jgi:hypothetical protein
VKRIVYLAAAALVALLILAPSALAQEDTVPGDDDPFLPEPNAVVVDEDALQQIAGQQLPKTGGPDVVVLLLPAAAFLAGSGILAYTILRRR